MRSTGYVFQTDMAYRTLQAGLRVVEVPIEFVERVRGDSKMSGAVARESLRRITVWGLQRARRAGTPRGPAGAPAPAMTARRRTRRPAGSCSSPSSVVPLLEIYVLIQVGQVIGAWWTIALLLADAILGAWLIRREGGRAWQSLTTSLQSGRMPARELADARADPDRRHPDAHAGLRHRRRRAAGDPAVHPAGGPPAADPGGHRAPGR